MDKAEDQAAIVMMQQAMIVAQAIGKGAHLLKEAGRVVVIVMQMDFNVGEARPGQLSE